MQSIVGLYVEWRCLMVAAHSISLLFSGTSAHARTHARTHPHTDKQKHMGAHAQPFQANIRYVSTTILQYVALTNIPTPCLTYIFISFVFYSVP